MKAAFFFLILSSLSAFAGNPYCPKLITYDDYTHCASRPKYMGGFLDLQCESGPHRGCCYRRMGGAPEADLQRIKCAELSSRQPSTLKRVEDWIRSF